MERAGADSSKGAKAGRRCGGRGILPVSLLFLLLFGPALWVWSGKGRDPGVWLKGSPVAFVEGEAIFRSELEERLAVKRRITERIHGRGVFSGQAGPALLRLLEAQALEEALLERILARQAGSLKIGVSDEEVRQEMEKIGRDVYGNALLLEEGLRREGIGKEYLARRVRHNLLAARLGEAMALPGETPDDCAARWLREARGRARVEVGQASGLPAAGGCCSLTAGAKSGGAGCGTSARPAGPERDARARQAQKEALAAYRKGDPGGQGVSARVLDRGCHVEVDIEKDGRIVRSYAYQDGRIVELSR